MKPFKNEELTILAWLFQSFLSLCCVGGGSSTWNETKQGSAGPEVSQLYIKQDLKKLFLIWREETLLGFLTVFCRQVSNLPGLHKVTDIITDITSKEADPGNHGSCLCLPLKYAVDNLQSLAVVCAGGQFSVFNSLEVHCYKTFADRLLYMYQYIAL